MSRAHADAEKALFREVSRRLGTFLDDHRPSGPGQPVVVDVTVVVSWDLTEIARREVAESAADLRLDYDYAVPRVWIEVDHDLGAPFTVSVAEGIGVATGEPSVRVEEADLGPDADDDVMVLELRFGLFRFPHRLAPSAQWVPLSRGGATGIRFPDEAQAIPRAPLIELRNVMGTLAVRRTERDRHYLVSVNGTRIPHGENAGTRVAPQGSITIRESSGDAVAVIDFELHDRVDELRACGPSDPGDDGGIDAWICSSGFDKQIVVQPPPPSESEDARGFTVREKDGSTTTLAVKVRYTEGKPLFDEPNPDGSEKWHVKMYRCDTPEDAARLGRFLARQVGEIERANVAVGGSNQRPRWVIAPVHILELVPPAARLATKLADAGGRIPDGVDGKLARWFGVPDSPQPGTCVLVASAYLEKVGWLGASYRAEAPGFSQLKHLRELADGLEHCHGLNFAHGDIKPDNVRRLASTDRHGYVLIDGDSIMPLVCPAAEARPTDRYVSQAYRLQKAAGDNVHLRDLDRFGFALITITAVAGRERLAGLLVERGGGARDIDDHGAVLTALGNGWPDHWRAFATELAAPFGGTHFADPAWSMVEWIDRLAEFDTDLPSCGHPTCPAGECRRAGTDDDEYPPPHAAALRRIRDGARGGLASRRGPRYEIIQLLRREQAVAAVAAYRVSKFRWMAVVLVIPLVFAVTAIVGALR
ncbi:hypothetical protein JOD54_004190 [Actinokineospora baliensis]|uniref:hypothetical protein n=1 Tax=Actinokineospora baliensis TaxID=547056 RepID=UPI00195DBD07|nr:hypothetical protein [Actinokineospora baliensis]MBM7773986.1 hypothetical protein [Actinokineospora baliensis]